MVGGERETNSPYPFYFRLDVTVSQMTCAQQDEDFQPVHHNGVVMDSMYIEDKYVKTSNIIIIFIYIDFLLSECCAT